MSDESILDMVKRGLDHIEKEGVAEWTRISDDLQSVAKAVISQTKRTLADTAAAAMNYGGRVGPSPFDPRSPNQAPAVQPPVMRGEDVMPGETAPGGAFSAEARANEEKRPLPEQLLTGAFTGAPTALLGPAAVVGDVENALAEVDRTGGGTAEKWLAGGISTLPVVGGVAAAKAASKLKSVFGGSSSAVDSAWLDELNRLYDEARPPNPSDDFAFDVVPSEAAVSAKPERMGVTDVEAAMPRWDQGTRKTPEAVASFEAANAKGLSAEAAQQGALDALARGENPVHFLKRAAPDAEAFEAEVSKLGKKLGAVDGAELMAEQIGKAGGISPGGMFRGADGKERYIKTSARGGLPGLLDEIGNASAYRAMGVETLDYKLVQLSPADTARLKGRGLGSSELAGQRFAMASERLPSEWTEFGKAAESGAADLFSKQAADSYLRNQAAMAVMGELDVANNAGNLMLAPGGRVMHNDVGYSSLRGGSDDAKSWWADLVGAVKSGSRAAAQDLKIDADSAPEDLIAYVKRPEELKQVKGLLQEGLDRLESGAGTAGKTGTELFDAAKAFVKQHWPHYDDFNATLAARQMQTRLEDVRGKVGGIAAALLLIGFPGLEMYNGSDD